ncbi:hypothetical protein T4B_1844 [Trichinella pseudospiralis]|uniref:Uncharacterized protein n=1 Tax=Trichinella pseudospiralis TaxID=6337 RepID=A0A0V1IJD7_TRIPS|nr:hypothetical protein T4A_2160 [Trichinella pseudospiralis]KRZ22899.1 hypothetical protein T4B_1844 [Trichinella pseudospiralis]KRZ39744.1 hypothetical protein T4C_539 [Trichinella pseudospiralis]
MYKFRYLHNFTAGVFHISFSLFVIANRYSAIREGCSSSQFRVVFFKFDIYHLKREPTFHQRRSYGRLKSPTGQFYPNQVGLGSSTICDLNFHVTDLVY